MRKPKRQPQLDDRIYRVMIYLIEKWERHIRFIKEIDGLVKDVEKVFKDQRKGK